MNSRYKAVLLLVFTVMIWSTSGVMVKLSSWNAVALNGGRSAMAALTIWMYLRRPHFTWSRPQIEFDDLFLFQKVNHFPGNKQLARKDLLKKNIEMIQKLGNKIRNFFDIIPETFLLPG